MRIVVFLLVIAIVGFVVYFFFGKSFSNTTGSDGRSREGKRCEAEKDYILSVMKSINPKMKVTYNQPCPQ